MIGNCKRACTIEYDTPLFRLHESNSIPGSSQFAKKQAFGCFQRTRRGLCQTANAFQLLLLLKQRKPIGLFEILRPFTHKTQKKQRATTQLSFQSLQNYPPFAPKVVLAFGLHPIRFKPQTQTFSQFTHKHTTHTHTQHVHAATTTNDHDLVVALAIGAFQVLCRRQASVGTFHQTRTKAAQSQS